MSECFMIEDKEVTKYKKDIRIDSAYDFNKKINISFRACNLNDGEIQLSAWYKLLNTSKCELFPDNKKNFFIINLIENGKLGINNMFSKQIISSRSKLLEIVVGGSSDLIYLVEYDDYTVEGSNFILNIDPEKNHINFDKLVLHQSKITIHNKSSYFVDKMAVGKYPSWKFIDKTISFHDIDMGNNFYDISMQNKNFPQYLIIYFKICGKNISTLISDISVSCKLN